MCCLYQIRFFRSLKQSLILTIVIFLRNTTCIIHMFVIRLPHHDSFRIVRSHHNIRHVICCIYVYILIWNYHNRNNKQIQKSKYNNHWQKKFLKRSLPLCAKHRLNADKRQQYKQQSICNTM